MDLEVIRYVQQTLFRVCMSTKKEIGKLLGTTFTKSLKPARKRDIHRIMNIMMLIHCLSNIYNHLPVLR